MFLVIFPNRSCRRLVAAACGLFCTATLAFGQGTVAGTWRVESTKPPGTWTAVFRIDGNRLVGTVSSCLTPDVVGEIEGGTIDGNRIAFMCTRGGRTPETVRILTFTGMLRGDELVISYEKSGPAAAARPNDPFFGNNAPREFTLKRIPDASDALALALKTAADRIPVTPAVPFERLLRADREPQNWLTYSGSLAGQRHSLLTQVTPANVKELELAWTWQADVKNCSVATCGATTLDFQATPLVVDGILYTSYPPAGVIALDAATGRKLWTHEYAPSIVAFASAGSGRQNRGLAISGGTLFVGTIDAHLRAIDAFTGTLKWDVVVADAADPVCKGAGNCYVITHAPLVVKDMVLVGVGGGDGPIRGFVAAFDVRTGALRWKFHTIPGPGEPGHESWAGDSWRTGGAGVWQIGSYDAALNLTYWGVGNPYPSYDGSTRLGDNLYSNSVVALDADTGRVRWHYQFTPHDVWDLDSVNVPILADIMLGNQPRKVLLRADRNGLFYMLDRATGQFLLGKPFVPSASTNWYPSSFSPVTGLFYLPAQHRRPGTDTAPAAGYGTILALDPATGEPKWEFRRDDAIFSAGVLSTASGVLFTGTRGDPASDSQAAARQDRYFYALDAATGAQLWRMALPGSLRGSPMTYAVEGAQYVVVPAGDTLFAFSLRK